MLASTNATLIALATGIAMAFGCLSEDSGGQEIIQSSKKVLPLPDQYELKVKEFEPPLLLSNDPEAQLIELNRLQNKQWEQISSVRGKAWCHLIRAGDKQDTVSLTEFIWAKGMKTWELHWYPTKEDRAKEFYLPDTGIMDLVVVYLSTAVNFVVGTGYSRNGIDILEIELPTVHGSTTTGFDFHRIFVTNQNSPDEFHRQMIDHLKSGMFVVTVSRNETLMEVKLGSSTSLESYFQRWVFDLSKNGAAVYSSGTSIITTSYTKIGDYWLPEKKTEEVHNRKAWISYEEKRFFDFHVNTKIDEREFGIQSLPVGDEVIVFDKRTGRNQQRLFGQLSQNLLIVTDPRNRPNFGPEMSHLFPEQISLLPRSIDIDAAIPNVGHYLFVDIPPRIDLKRIDARVVDFDGLPAENVIVSASSISDYNQDFSERSSSFIPIVDRPGLVVFRMDFNFENPSEASHHRGVKVEAFDKNGELGTVSSSLSIFGS